MNRLELGRKIADLILGKKIEGKIAAVLPNRSNHSRYVVDTGEELLEVQIPKARYFTTIMPMPPAFESELSRDQNISRRLNNVKHWVNGQTV